MLELQYHPPAPPPAEERRGAIAEAVAAGSGHTQHVVYRDGYIEAPIATVDTGLLVYRAGNGRIFSEMVARGQTRQQRDDAEEQELIHELLVAKAKEPDGPIFAELEQRGIQTEPLLVTATGVVVNGNRRLASMRELAAVDRAKFGGFDAVSVAVLDASLSAGDIEYIEAALQLAPDLKLDYSWINRRLKLRDHVDHLGLPTEEIVAAYRFEAAEDIDRELAQLALAEDYLRYAGTPGDFEAIASLEDIFVSMHRELSVFENRLIVDLWTSAGFALIHARETLDAPLERYFPFSRPAPFEFVHWGMRSLGEEKGYVEEQQAGENKPVDRPLGDKLLRFLGEIANAEEAAARLMRLANRLRADADTEIGAAQLIMYLKKAKQNLVRLDRDHVTGAQLNEIRAELAAIENGFANLGEKAGQGDENRGIVSRFLRSR